MGTYKYLSGIMRNKQLDMVRLLAEMKCWNYTQNRSILHALRPLQTHEAPRLGNEANQLLLLLKSGSAGRSTFQANRMTKDVLGVNGIPVLYRQFSTRDCIPRLPFLLKEKYGANTMIPFSTRSISSKASERPRQNKSEKQKGQSGSETKKDISTVEDVFDAPTYNIPEKPVTFVEGASYTAIIIIGLGIAAAAGYAVFKELIFQPKEYKVFNKALKRIQDDSQVRVRIGSPITGYGQESRNRAARQRIPHKTWTDEEGVEHVEINFFIRGPHGTGKVYSEMFKDQVDKQWKYTYLIVEIRSPTPSQLILESYMPAYNVEK
ncbi:probable mitochondrial import inner membrane translocase subunit TIM21 isoform X1 [Quercus lobata]|uniref:probable mitochondrial import inner membrane translocase subunit TIM21 isoform X1 n=1 Tax=Quercus lobata TaxID=97700 RepID=UPI001247C68D|nr:probable mitochondrial import inner membrane translocase subunit TIM21 isoform X1 [Quercus lobata]